MDIRRIFAIFIRYMMLLRDSPQRLMMIFVWGSLDVVLWGFITKYLNAVGNAQFSFVPALLGAVILLDFLSRVQQGTATPVLEDIWSNNLLNFFASPLKIGEYVIGLVLCSVVTTALALSAMAGIALFAFGFSLFDFGLMLFGFLFVLFLFGVTMGVIGSAIVLRFGPSAEWFVWPMMVVLSPFMGVFYPISVLPAWMQMVSHALPPSYVFEGMRALVLGTPISPSTLVIGAGLGLLYIILAQMFFVRVYRTVVRQGLLARYSAENV
jgi:ABC-2 type transport system permease protein